MNLASNFNFKVIKFVILKTIKCAVSRICLLPIYSHNVLGLDETIGDVYADIIDSQLEIMKQIVDEAVKCEDLLKTALDICSELDW